MATINGNEAKMSFSNFSNNINYKGNQTEKFKEA